MGQAPSTVVQLALLVVVVLPGAVYQFMRERFRGPLPGERGLGERVLRALAASAVLDSSYAVIAGPQLVRLARDQEGGWQGVLERPRAAGLTGLLLFFVVPAASAAGVSWWQRRRLCARYRSTPTSWDHMFRSQGSCFVRVRLKDGSWAGGWYGSLSYATSFPQSPALFLESAWRLDPDGGFGHRIEHSARLHIRAEDTDVLELLEPPREARE